MNISIAEQIRDVAVNQYKVDPLIFIIIYIISIPVCYYCLFLMGKIIWHLREKHQLKGREIIKNKSFIRALVVYQIAWISPYLYVMLWGQNLPLWFWVFLISIIGFSIYFFYLRIKKKTSSN